MKHFILILIAWVLLPVVSTPSGNMRPNGVVCQADPGKFCYEPNIPSGVRALPGFRYAVHAPSNADGTPKFSDVYVWIPDSIFTSTKLSAVPMSTARNQILSRDPIIDIRAIESMP